MMASVRGSSAVSRSTVLMVSGGDQQGLEVDFVLPRKGGARLIEVKASSTISPAMAAPMQRLAASWRKHPASRGNVEMLLVHRAPRRGPHSRAISQGVRAPADRNVASRSGKNDANGLAVQRAVPRVPVAAGEMQPLHARALPDGRKGGDAGAQRCELNRGSSALADATGDPRSTRSWTHLGLSAMG